MRQVPFAPDVPFTHAFIILAESVTGVNRSILRRRTCRYVKYKIRAKMAPWTIATINLEPLGGRVMRIPGVKRTKRRTV